MQKIVTMCTRTCTHTRTHARRHHVGRSEVTRGEDNVRRVLTRHIFGCCPFQCLYRSTVILEHEHCTNRKISQFSIFIITILLYVRNYTPAKRMLFWLEYS